MIMHFTPFHLQTQCCLFGDLNEMVSKKTQRTVRPTVKRMPPETCEGLPWAGEGGRDRESLKWGIRVGTRCPSKDTRVPHGGKITGGTATIRNVYTRTSAGERR